jgi:hypothetical protein
MNPNRIPVHKGDCGKSKDLRLLLVNFYPFAALTASVSAGTTSNRSPTIP